MFNYLTLDGINLACDETSCEVGMDTCPKHPLKRSHGGLCCVAYMLNKMQDGHSVCPAPCQTRTRGEVGAAWTRRFNSTPATRHTRVIYAGL